MKMQLYEINKAINDVINRGFSVDEETGEITFTSEDLEQLEMDAQDKIENTALYIKQLKADSDMLKNEEENLKKRRKQLENKTEWLENYLSDQIQLLGLSKVETPRVLVKTTKGTSVEVIDSSIVPCTYLKIIEDIRVDKKAIKEAWKRGETVKGVIAQTNYGISIK